MRDNKLSSMVALLVFSMIAMSMMSMSTLRMRDLAQRNHCGSRLKHLALATHNYHSAYKQLPPAVTGTDGTDPTRSNQLRLSGFAALLPFMDQQAAWSKLSDHSSGSGYPSMGPVPSTDPSEYPLWGVQFDGFLCPSERAERGEYGMRSYLLCYGDGIKSVGRTYRSGATGLDSADEMKQFRSVSRGIFTPGIRTRFRDVLDGLSNTMMYGETAISLQPGPSNGSVAMNVEGLVNRPLNLLSTVDPKNPMRYRESIALWSVGKGTRWPEGSFMMNAFTSVFPPGGPSGTQPQDPFSGCVSATSLHPDGVYVAMADGAVRFVSESIDTGDLSSKSVCWDNGNEGTESPYGVWGAMGTRFSKEIIPSEREAAFESVRSY